MKEKKEGYGCVIASVQPRHGNRSRNRCNRRQVENIRERFQLAFLAFALTIAVLLNDGEYDHLVLVLKFALIDDFLEKLCDMMWWILKSSTTEGSKDNRIMPMKNTNAQDGAHLVLGDSSILGGEHGFVVISLLSEVEGRHSYKRELERMAEERIALRVSATQYGCEGSVDSTKVPAHRILPTVLLHTVEYGIRHELAKRAEEVGLTKQTLLLRMTPS